MEHLILIIVATNIIVILAVVSVGIFFFHRMKKSDGVDRENKKWIPSTVLEMTKIHTKVSVSKIISGNFNTLVAAEYEKFDENERSFL